MHYVLLSLQYCSRFADLAPVARSFIYLLSDRVGPLVLLIFCKIILFILISLHFHIYFRIIFCNSTNSVRIFPTFSLWINWSKIDIFTIFSHAFNAIWLYEIKSSFVSSISFSYFASVSFSSNFTEI